MLFRCKVNALREQLQYFYKMKRMRLLDNIKRTIHKKHNCLLWIAHLKSCYETTISLKILY